LTPGEFVVVFFFLSDLRVTGGLIIRLFTDSTNYSLNEHIKQWNV